MARWEVVIETLWAVASSVVVGTSAPPSSRPSLICFWRSAAITSYGPRAGRGDGAAIHGMIPANVVAVADPPR